MNFNTVNVVFCFASRERAAIKNHLMPLFSQRRIDMLQSKIRSACPGVLRVSPVDDQNFQRDAPYPLKTIFFRAK